MKKKETERFFVEWFVDKIGWDSCEILEDEEPDFKIKFPEKIIGLEVTNLYKDERRKGSQKKRNEAYRNTWLSKVSEKYYEISEQPLSVQVLISIGELDGDPEALSYELAQRNTPEVWERTEFEFKQTDKCKLKIFFVRLPKYKEKYKEIILLIVLDRTCESGMFHAISDRIMTAKCGFSSVYLSLYPESYMEIG